MPSKMHRKMGYFSYISLPKWQKDWWDFSLDSLGEFGLKEVYKSKEEKISDSCLIPDSMGWKWDEEKYKRYKKYLLFEERHIPHGPVDNNFNCVWVSFNEHDQYNFLLILNYYTKKFFETLKNREFDLSVIFAGILGHIIQESSYPSHSISNLFFYNYFPRPRKLYISYHDIIDKISIRKIKKFKPEIIGITPEEISYKLWVELEKNFLWQKRNLYKILNSINKNKKNIVKILRPSIEKGIKLFSDIIYTSISIVTDSIKEKDVKRLEKFSLYNLVPYYIHPGGRYRDIPGNFSIIDGKRRSLFLKNRKINEGIGLCPFVSIKYILQQGLFSKFTCKVGISSITREKKVKETRVKFMIEIDKDINNEYTPDLNYKKTEKVFQNELSFEKVFDVNVNIKMARTLIISSISEEVNINGSEKILFPDIVIEKPVFIK
ncbi:MAG: hypothetical protein NC833_00590 [Candidatus Omnitrophica bacterium]|nr:hypothetical protein [Candidatus Omnitrophota bacterium]